MRVFFPDKYTGGYVYRSLKGKHSVIRENSEFKLDGIKCLSSELPIKVLEEATCARVERYAEGVSEQIGSNYDKGTI